MHVWSCVDISDPIVKKVPGSIMIYLLITNVSPLSRVDMSFLTLRSIT